MGDNIRGSILFVDNDRCSGETMSTLLEVAGYQAIVNRNISEAFQYARSQYFDLILLGWHLGDGTGVDLCRAIRQHDEKTPILFYADISAPQEIRKALEAGAQGYFIKPVDIGNLLQMIETQIKGSAGEEQLPSA
jgi:DNA-binding response OmpR family regulator